MILGTNHSYDATLYQYVYGILVPLWKEIVADEAGPIKSRCRPKKFWEAMTDLSPRSIGEELCYATQYAALMCCYCIIL